MDSLKKIIPAVLAAAALVIAVAGILKRHGRKKEEVKSQ